jgi:hypothetical protein
VPSNDEKNVPIYFLVCFSSPFFLLSWWLPLRVPRGGWQRKTANKSWLLAAASNLANSFTIKANSLLGGMAAAAVGLRPALPFTNSFTPPPLFFFALNFCRLIAAQIGIFLRCTLIALIRRHAAFPQSVSDRVH